MPAKLIEARTGNLVWAESFDRKPEDALALAAGVPVKVVSEQLGHSSATLTLDTCNHVLPHMQDEAAARVAALLEESDHPTDHGSRKKTTKPENPHTIGIQTIQ